MKVFIAELLIYYRFFQILYFIYLSLCKGAVDNSHSRASNN